MTRYDHIVGGGGVGGMTAALLLARHNRRVLLLDKAPRLGGALARFTRQGVPFDVGFHFTGGLNPDGSGMMSDMLAVMGIRERIEAIPLPEDKSHRVAFADSGEIYALPNGLERCREYLRTAFPADQAGIARYFDLFTQVCRRTASMNIRQLDQVGERQEQDWVSLQQVLDSLIDDPRPKALLAVTCLCHGSKPAEISFANHCRMTAALYDHTVRVKNGGAAFVGAFADALRECGVEVRCSTQIAELKDVRDRKVRRFMLSDGDQVAADSCVLAIHPFSILELLPKRYTTPAFRHRVAEFEPSIGFFSIFGTAEGNGRAGIRENSIFSILPSPDLNRMMDPGADHPLPMVMMESEESVAGRELRTVTAFEVSFRRQLAAWQDTAIGRRGSQYLAYKRERADDMRRRLQLYHPWMEREFKLMASASMLTFRDYLHSPFGAAYGIRQKVGQFNLFGKLPLLNLYAAGQSAMLPGVLGSMASGFFVARSMIGKTIFQKFVEDRLCH